LELASATSFSRGFTKKWGEKSFSYPIFFEENLKLPASSGATATKTSAAKTAKSSSAKTATSGREIAE
jgi:hypothetical protein